MSKIDRLMKQAQSALQGGDRDAALRSCEAVLEKSPRHLDALYLSGTLLAELGHFERAAQRLQAAARVNPGSPYIQNNLGNVHLLRGQLGAAEQAFRAALRASPVMFEALTNMANLLVRRGLLGEAIDVASKALAARPHHIASINAMANALKDQGRIEEALQWYSRAAQLAPDHAAVQSNWLMALNYSPSVTAEAVCAAHRDWGLRQGAGQPIVDRPPAPQRDRIRLAYLSPDFGRHPVGYLIEQVLAAHDRTRFEVVLYSDVVNPDDVTQRLRAHADTWRDVQGSTDDQVAALVAADAPDVLIELAGHGSGNRLAVLSQRLAPVQVSYLGYPATSGLSTIDYIITDTVLDPADAPAWYTEQPWRLPRCCFAFRPDADYPEVSPLPAGVSGAVTFGSFNALAKVNDAVLDRWSAVLQAIPASALLIQARALDDPLTRRLLLARLAERGIAPERIEAVGSTPLSEHLALIGRTDVVLDTWPWNGHMTTLNCLWMGVPVLTLAGSARASRMGLAMLRALDLDDYIARDGEDFVARAVAATQDLARLSSLRANMRARLGASSLADGPGLARALEAAYLEMLGASARGSR